MEKVYSIVVPIYNVQEHINDCINSLINQTYKNIEIVLVDDGSLDNCPAICDKWAKRDKRIKVIHKQNGGLVSARKAGAEVSTGDYVLCVDGDDYIDLIALEKINNIIEENQCDAVCFGYYTGKNFDIKVSNPYEKGFYHKQKLIEKIYPCLIESRSGEIFHNSICCKVIKRDNYIKEQMQVDDRIKIGEDLACTKPIIAKAESIYIMDDCFYYYRVNTSSMTKNRRPFSWDNAKLLHKHLKNRLVDLDYDFNEQIYRNSCHNLFNVAITQFYDKGRTQREIKNDIKKNLEDSLNKEIIEKAKYRSLSRKLMQFSLKKRLYFLLKLYSKIHKF